MNTTVTRGVLAWLVRRSAPLLLAATIAGLAAVGLAVCAAVALVASYVASGSAAAVITGCLAVLFGALWFALPLARRRARARLR